MPPLPKKKHTKARQGGRSAHHFRVAPNLSKCPNCGATAMPHRVCRECGFYNGRQVFEPGESAAPPTESA